MAITLTKAAAEQIKKFLTKDSSKIGLRLGVKTTGCSGFAYVVEMVDQVQAADHVYEQEGVKVVVDAQSLAFLDGTEVDFTREGLNSHFKFNNPNVANTCGCGESFSVNKKAS